MKDSLDTLHSSASEQPHSTTHSPRNLFSSLYPFPRRKVYIWLKIRLFSNTMRLDSHTTCTIHTQYTN